MSREIDKRDVMIEYSLICDYCSEILTDFTEEGLINTAKRSGWIINKEDNTCCDSCKEEQKDERNNSRSED